jgi:putative acetyltransferase
VVVRELVIEDYDSVYALWQSCVGIGLSAADSRSAIEAYLSRNPGLSSVVEEDGRVLATVLCGHDGRRGFLHHLAVAYGHRRRGLGRRLTERSLELLGAQGIGKCHVFVFRENVEGGAFWHRVGFDRREEIALFSRELDVGRSSALPTGAAAEPR